tara:strand:- start:92 stop:412 length:321 start_codon:yes stop_codon:yes gene_type:complete
MGLSKRLTTGVKMAYSFNWTPDENLTDQQILSYVKDLAVESTDNRFHVNFASDDGGRHICIYVEREEGEEGVWDESHFEQDHKGWRILRVSVPVGYIETFLLSEKQ